MCENHMNHAADYVRARVRRMRRKSKNVKIQKKTSENQPKIALKSDGKKDRNFFDKSSKKIEEKKNEEILPTLQIF